MTGRGRALLLCALGILFTALTLGGRIFYLSFLFVVLSLLFSLISVLLSRYRFPITCTCTPPHILRGEEGLFSITLPRRGLLPVSEVGIQVEIGMQTHLLSTLLSRRQPTSLSMPLYTPHVGLLRCTRIIVSYTDILGLIQARITLHDPVSLLLVLPRAFEVAPLRMASGDDGRALPNRTTEDLSSPEDTRAYRAGDPLKRVHWKLSARRRVLTVRRYETPAPPNTLILLDCTRIDRTHQTPAQVAALQDALCETTLSVAVMQSQSDAPVRVPLYGQSNREFLSNRHGSTALLEEMLAREDFSADSDFSRILHLELRRMRRTGATVIISTRLTPMMVEGIKHIRRMGPSVRLYLVTFTPDSPSDLPYVLDLQQSLVEVCYVTPA